MYPMRLKPVYKEIIWGGTRFSEWGKPGATGRKIAESWELSARPGDESIISNGRFEGRGLYSLMREQPVALCGKFHGNDFPLFFKLIDAAMDLSVQVHPDDEYALASEGQKFGKDETWMILDCQADSKIVYGLKEGVDRETFTQSLANGKISDLLNYVSIKKGDVYNVYPGLVHALGAGIVAAEVQQNSNTTYRIYDYERTGPDGRQRELHTRKALDVICFKNKYSFSSIPGWEETDNDLNLTTTYVHKKQYVFQTLKIDQRQSGDTKGESFHMFFAVEGSGQIISDEGTAEISHLETVLVPAGTGSYEIKGKILLIKAFVPFNREIMSEIYSKNPEIMLKTAF